MKRAFAIARASMSGGRWQLEDFLASRIDFHRLLGVAAGAIAAIIILGTAIAFASGKRPGQAYRRADPAGVEEIKGAAESLRAFKEFGTLRIVTLPDEKSGDVSYIALTPWFSYEESGSAFYEELVSKKMLFASLFMEFFSRRTKNALLSAGERAIKEELLARFNSDLVLGELSGLYFDDYLFLE